MSVGQGLIKELEVTEAFFLHTISALTTEDAEFKPVADMYSVAGHIDHVADTVRWFVEGAFFRADGFDLNFEAMVARSQQQTDLEKAKQMVIDAFAFARDTIAAQPEENLFAPLPDGPIMAGAPRLAIVSAIVDHTAHHRGALAVYTRLLNKTPPMPYEVLE